MVSRPRESHWCSDRKTRLSRLLRRARELFRHDRYLGQIDIGGLPYAKVAEGIELLAGEVLPKVK